MEEPRAFCSYALMRARLHCLYARNSWRCPALRAGVMGSGEKSYRLYSCGRCAKQVRICVGCDRGNRYCAEDCAQIRRRETRCRAAARYQQSYCGALKHAARQRAWRRRQQQKVTHQGSLEEVAALIVASSSTFTPTQEPHGETSGIRPALPVGIRRTPAHWEIDQTKRLAPRCCFCGCVLAAFARLGPLRNAQ